MTVPEASPECGTDAARTRLVVIYKASDGKCDLAEFYSCCAERTPPDMEALLDEAEVTEIAVMDGYTKTVYDSDTIRRTYNPRPGLFIPGRPWSWTKTEGLDVHIDPLGPDDPIEIIRPPAIDLDVVSAARMRARRARRATRGQYDGTHYHQGNRYQGTRKNYLQENGCDTRARRLTTE